MNTHVKNGVFLDAARSTKTAISQVKALHQPCLFDQPLSHRADPVTSYKAADRMGRSGAAQRQRDACLEALRRHNGCTSAELADFMGVSRHMPGRRMIDLVRRGLVKQGPERKCRIVNSPCMTYFVAETFGPKEQ